MIQNLYVVAPVIFLSCVYILPRLSRGRQLAIGCTVFALCIGAYMICAVHVPKNYYGVQRGKFTLQVDETPLATGTRFAQPWNSVVLVPKVLDKQIPVSAHCKDLFQLRTDVTLKAELNETFAAQAVSSLYLSQGDDLLRWLEPAVQMVWKEVLANHLSEELPASQAALRQALCAGIQKQIEEQFDRQHFPNATIKVELPTFNLNPCNNGPVEATVSIKLEQPKGSFFHCHVWVDNDPAGPNGFTGWEFFMLP